MSDQPQAAPAPAPAPVADEAPSLNEIIESAQTPITPESVVSEPPAEVPAPDSSILKERLDKMLSREDSIAQRRAQEAEYAQLQEQVKMLRTLVGPDWQAKYNEVTQKVEQKDDDQSQLMKQLQNELNQMRESQDKLKTELEQRQQQNELMEASQEVAKWVEQNNEHFPLINKSGHTELVFQKMWNTKQQTGHMISETQAAREIEEELSGLVKQLAPLMGYEQREQRAERDEAISTTTTGLTLSEPFNRDEASDTERLEWLIRQAQG